MLRKPWVLAILLGVCIAGPVGASASGNSKYGDLLDWDATYRDALDRWAAGDASALADLAAFDRRHTHAANCLQTVPLSLAAELAREEPANVVPQILLHEKLVILHALSRHTAEMKIQRELHRELLDQYLDAAQIDGGEDRELAARLLVIPAALSLQMRDVLSLEHAQALLKLALEIDPDHVMALQLQAQLHEIDGRFRHAAQILEQVLELDPGLPGARLHLAMAYLRSGREEPGRRQLADLAREAEDWVAEVAYQELVRETVRLGDLRGAARILDQALERFPAGSELWLQSAALDLRRGRQPSAPSEAHIERWSAVTEPSPRYRFDRGPFHLLDSYEATFHETIEQHQARLREALASIDASETLRLQTWSILGTKKFMGGCQGFLKREAK